MYRQEEGLWARVPTALIGGAITFMAASSASKIGSQLTGIICAGIVFLALALATVYVAFFHHKIGDVLVDTESEMRKVVWPSRQEVQGSSTVVIFTSLLLGIMIYGADLLLIKLLVAAGLY